jgi:hypothetical protein
VATETGPCTLATGADPLIGVLLLSFYLLAREWRRPSAGVLVVLWLCLSLIPISTSARLGTPARKRTPPDPPSAWHGIAAVSIWDRLEAVRHRASTPERVSPSSPDDPAPRDARERRLLRWCRRP